VQESVNKVASAAVCQMSHTHSTVVDYAASRRHFDPQPPQPPPGNLGNNLVWGPKAAGPSWTTYVRFLLPWFLPYFKSI